ncbi:MAG: hypothetical protein AAGI25_18210 [Bacteroidota bacterium]
MAKNYIIDGARIKFNSHIGTFKVLADVPKIQDKPAGTIVEKDPSNFIFDDGFVLSTLQDWVDSGDIKFQDNEVLIEDSTIQGIGRMPGALFDEKGKVEFIHSGQTNQPTELQPLAAPVIGPIDEPIVSYLEWKSNKVANDKGKTVDISDEVIEESLIGEKLWLEAYTMGILPGEKIRFELTEELDNNTTQLFETSATVQSDGSVFIQLASNDLENKTRTINAKAIYDENTTANAKIELFPNGIYMNVGVALMPFMDKGYHFIKEDNFSYTKAEGFNEVEVDFVKYLYKIRKANRENSILDYRIFPGPRHLKTRERIFVAGKIFPVLSISYSGEDIDCSTPKIKTKSVSSKELQLLFGDEYKAFSLEYISVDNDNLRIYVPKYSEIGIDYKDLLIDFLINGTKTKDVVNYGEFPDLDTYTLATGKNELTVGCWLTKNREADDSIWKNACMYIVKHKLQGVLAPFVQIADFYALLDYKITNETKHKTRWLKGAKKLVKSLKRMDGGSIFIANDVETILNELNLGICDYAITQFYELFYGKYKDNPLIKLQDAYEWDLAFVEHEQGVVAVPIYSKANKITISRYQDMADQDAKGWHGLAGWGSDMALKIVPEFDDPWEGEVTDAQFRIDLPMLMLWLDRHKPTGENFKDKVDENGYLLEEYKQIIEKYEAK